MSDDSLQWLAPRPDLEQPKLVVMLTGWIDAGGAAQTAVEAIEQECATSPVAVFDDDTYVDFRARRPTMELREGHNAVLNWERITLSVGRDRAGHDILLLSGPEPDTAWHRFVRIVGELATELSVSSMAHLGAYPFALPHTRPSRLSITSPSHDVLARVPFLRSSLDVPAGVAAALEHELHDRGIPSLGIWAQVPHYISSMAYPAAAVALVEGLRESIDLVVDATGLRSDVLAQARRLDAMIAGNDDHAKMVSQLEEIYDASDDHAPGTAPDAEVNLHPDLELTSGDEIAAELEEYLRDQD